MESVKAIIKDKLPDYDFAKNAHYTRQGSNCNYDERFMYQDYWSYDYFFLSVQSTLASKISKNQIYHFLNVTDA